MLREIENIKLDTKHLLRLVNKSMETELGMEIPDDMNNFEKFDDLTSFNKKLKEDEFFTKCVSFGKKSFFFKLKNCTKQTSLLY